MKPLIAVVIAEVYRDMTDTPTVWLDFLGIVNRLPGVNVIGTQKHDFPGGGFSGVALLSESHAAIHTWPEDGRAWVELATCGDPAALPAFVEELRQWGDSVELREGAE